MKKELYSQELWAKECWEDEGGRKNYEFVLWKGGCLESGPRGNCACEL